MMMVYPNDLGKNLSLQILDPNKSNRNVQDEYVKLIKTENFSNFTYVFYFFKYSNCLTVQWNFIKTQLGPI